MLAMLPECVGVMFHLFQSWPEWKPPWNVPWREGESTPCVRHYCILVAHFKGLEEQNSSDQEESGEQQSVLNTMAEIVRNS